MLTRVHVCSLVFYVWIGVCVCVRAFRFVCARVIDQSLSDDDLFSVKLFSIFFVPNFHIMMGIFQSESQHISFFWRFRYSFFRSSNLGCFEYLLSRTCARRSKREKSGGVFV